MIKGRPQHFRVVLIEDDPMVRDIHRQFIEQTAGFAVVGTAGNGAEGAQLIRRLHPDLAILDIFMPMQDGLETLQQLRSEPVNVDVIAITAANDTQTIRKVLQLGAVDYIMKPFKYDRVKRALEHYRNLRTQIEARASLSQTDLDRMLQHGDGGSGGGSAPNALPKGLQEQTKNQIMGYLLEQEEARSAEEVADGVGIARVTARRYLEHLEKSGVLALDVHYGSVGRPVNRYRVKRK
ncbi:chemotaxis protein CheY [Gordoniibacillus kamchatkensis]|uniref:Transcriptional regulatory protein n=1 Tax=Gordoniibacillus kamchatkensis TaxID=1590651 RepID=A0ABR5AGB1_9BACL|nr:response regulator [Paenibacillus sp. VKM B-2647]KIL39863.1 chemotaxis protein CheY [Paenibacillus sp. VKM B-2647]